MSRIAPALTVLPRGIERTAKVDLPFGAFVDSITTQLEGYKRRTKDGFKFTDSPHNLALIRSNFPDLPIEFPLDFSLKPNREDVPLGFYAGPKDKPLYQHQ